VGAQAFAVIREAIRKKGMVALGRIVFSTREHVIGLEPRGKGLFGFTLRYPYEIRKDKDCFDDIPDETTPKEMIELAAHIIDQKLGHFKPDTFEDRYETALHDIIRKKICRTDDRASQTRKTEQRDQSDGCPQEKRGSRAGWRRTHAKNEKEETAGAQRLT
jgi:DNA end-binding protein Ku